MCWASRFLKSARYKMIARPKTLNIAEPGQLLLYLRERGLIDADEAPEFHALSGGVSNRTVWVGRQVGADWVIKQALEKLRVQVDWFSDPERIQREAAGLRWLGEIIPGHVPDFVFDDPGHHIMAMTAIPQPHENWKAVLLEGRTKWRLAQSFGRLLAKDSQRGRGLSATRR